MENRRQFTRVLYAMKAQLEVENEIYDVAIEDISLNGALVKTIQKTIPVNNKLGLLTFKFSDSQNVVMHIAVIHNQESEIGLRVNAIDIDSISILRRIIELNLGDSDQINKELCQLTRTL